MQDALKLLINDLTLDHLFSDEDAGALRSLTDQSPTVFTSGAEMVEADARVPQIYLITAGWTVTRQILEDGRQQVLDFNTTGEIPAPATIFLADSNVSVLAMTPVQAVVIPRRALENMLHGHPAIVIGLAKYLAQVNQSANDRTSSLGQRSAYERVAMLLLDLQTKHARAHKGADNRLEIRCPQTMVADALGLSVVHVNRTIRALERENVVDWQRHQIFVRQPERLHEILGNDDLARACPPAKDLLPDDGPTPVVRELDAHEC